MSKNPLIKEHLFILLAFLLCFLYWFYIGFLSEMVIAHDAMVYENHALRFFQGGWVEYLSKGPAREPLYPLMISTSMHIGKFFEFSYIWIQKVFQIAILFLSQILMLMILKKLNVRPILSALAILYVGISPGLINSALSLYSEIAAFPFVLLIILLSSSLFSTFETSSAPKIIWRAVWLGLFFFLATCVKGVFQLIVPVYSTPFLIYLFTQLKNKNKTKRILIFLAAFFLSFYIPLQSYKLANKVYNGNFTFTTRGAWAFYGNTVRRTVKNLSQKEYLAALAFVPGPRVCMKYFTDEDCIYWTDEPSNYYGAQRRDVLQKQNMSVEKQDKIYTKEAIKAITQKPVQFSILAFFEWLKMFFWESTKIGYVAYPDWMDQVFWNPMVENIFGFTLAGLTFISFLFLTIYLIIKGRKIFADEQIATLLFIFIMIFAFNSFHSLFFVLTRYIFPIASLYLIVIAFCLDRIILGIKK